MKRGSRAPSSRSATPGSRSRCPRPPAPRPPRGGARRRLPRLQRGLLGRRRPRGPGGGGDPARARARGAPARRARGARAARAHALPRRAARRAVRGGELVLLADQDRSLWDAARLTEGRAALDRALALRGRGAYVLQAAIASPAGRARDRLGGGGGALRGAGAGHGSPVVELNRAVAVAEAGAPEEALELVDGSTSTTTATCTPRAPSSCAGSTGRGGPRRVQPGARARATPRPSGGSCGRA